MGCMNLCGNIVMGFICPYIIFAFIWLDFYFMGILNVHHLSTMVMGTQVIWLSFQFQINLFEILINIYCTS
jgi:hypothetical protein